MALGAIAVSGLDGDDIHAGRFQRLGGAFFTQVMHGVASRAADDGNFVARLQLAGNEFTGHGAAQAVVRANESRFSFEGINVGVNQDHRNTGVHSLLQGGR